MVKISRQKIALYLQDIMGYLGFLMKYLGFQYNQTFEMFCIYNKNEIMKIKSESIIKFMLVNDSKNNKKETLFKPPLYLS